MAYLRRVGTPWLAATLALFVWLAVVELPAAGRDFDELASTSGGGSGDYLYLPNEMLVRFKDNASQEARGELLGRVGVTKSSAFRNGIELVRLEPSRHLESAIEELRSHPLVEYAEPNYVFTIDATPDDRRYPEQWSLKNTGQSGGEIDEDIYAEAAWDVTTGSNAVLVAVMDTGVNYDHPDLAANMWLNPGEIPDNEIDDDENGFIDDVRGWDFRNDDNDPADDNGHGTKVAGVIGAVGHNDQGIAGVCWKVGIVPLKFLNRYGQGTAADAIAALEYAAAIGVHVVNASWGGDSNSQALKDAIDDAGEAGILVVASSGNDNANIDIAPHYPASYDSPNIISVTATDSSGYLYYYSNYGAVSVDLGAPGRYILTTSTSGYSWASGTSLAAPHVSGAAALLRSAARNMRALELKTLVLQGADWNAHLQNITVTGKRLNAYGPLIFRDEEPPGAIDDLRINGTTSSSIYLHWTSTGDDGAEGQASIYDVRVSTELLTEGNFLQGMPVGDGRVPAESGVSETMEILGLLPETPYYVAVKAEDEWGNAGPISNVVSTTTGAIPAAEVSPEVFDLTLFVGQTTIEPLMLRNVGEGTLDWRIRRPVVFGSSGAISEPLILATPDEGRIVAGDSDASSIAFDARGVTPDVYESVIEVVTNDPARPKIDLPVRFVVVSAPDVGIRVAEVVESSETFFQEDVTTTHSLPIPSPVGEVGTLEIIFEGDFGGPSEKAAVYAEGLLLGVVGEFGTDCTPSSVEFDLSPADLAGLTADGVLEVEVQNYVTVQVTCPINRHTVRFDYLAEIDSVEYGGLLVGESREREIGIVNLGSEPLEVSSVVSNLPEFLASTPPITVHPGAEPAIFPIVFVPSTAGSFDGVLSITSNDPDTPLVAVGLHGEGFPAPDVRVEPAAIDSSVYIRGRIERTLTVANQGAGPLEFTLEESRTGPHFFDLSRTEGTVAPGEELPIIISLGLPSLNPGSYDAVLEVHSNDPINPKVEIPVSLSVVGGPDLGVAGSTVLIETGSDFSGRGAETVHNLDMTIDPGGAGLLTVDYEGDYSGSSELAGVLIDGVLLDVIGVGALDCQPNRATWPLSLPTLQTHAAVGGMEVSIRNNYDVDSHCERNHHDVRLEYPAAVDSLDFDTVFVNHTSSLPLVLTNNGTETLEVTSIECSAPEIVPSVSALLLAPGDSQEIAISFSPVRVADVTGVLEIVSNDPDMPVAMLEVSGLGREPPTLTVNPPTIDVTLYSGGRQDVTLSLSNTGFSDLGFAVELDPEDTDFILFDPGQGSLPAGASTEVTVTLDAWPLLPGLHEADLSISSNDPESPRVVVPVALTVVGAPDITLETDPVTVDSSVGYAQWEARTVHSWTVPSSSITRGSLEVVATGDFYYQDETASVFLEGSDIGTVGGKGVWCDSNTEVFDLSAPQLAEAFSDGLVEVEVQNSDRVSPTSCPVNDHTVRLSYLERLRELDFGTVFVGDDHGLSFIVTNSGTERLEIESISSDHPEFSADRTSFSLDSGISETVTVTFSPGSPDSIVSVLTIVTNDPDEAEIALDMIGHGQEPPVVRVEPAELIAALPAGGGETRSLTILNDGPSPLTFEITVDPADGFLVTEPPAGTVAPFGSLAVDIEIDASDLVGGLYQAEILIDTNDPVTPSVTVPVTLSVTGIPDIRAGQWSPAQESTVAFDDHGAQTSHDVQIETPPFWDALVEVVVAGDYGDPNEVAGVWIDDIRLGTAGGVGGSCPEAHAAFSVASEDLAEISSDQAGNIVVWNAYSVSPHCPDSAHTVRFRTRVAATGLDFGGVFVGDSKLMSFAVINAGTEVLRISSISSDVAGFEPALTVFDLPPGIILDLDIEFAPSGVGSVSGTLRIESNDPDTPAMMLPLTGVGLDPPVLSLDPASIDVVVPEAGVESRPLTLSNLGGNPLVFTLEPVPAGDSFFVLDALSGEVPPGEMVAVEVALDADELPVGSYAGGIVVSTNDPSVEQVDVPVTLSIIAAPNLVVGGDVWSDEQWGPFPPYGNNRELFPRTHESRNGGAVLNVTAEGDFDAPDEYAVVSVNDEGLGNVGESGIPCGAAQTSFYLSPHRFAAAIDSFGRVKVRLDGSNAVATTCPVNGYSVRLAHATVLEPDFGTEFVGYENETTLSLENSGSETLEISDISSDSAAFTATPTALTVAPGAIETVVVAFLPSVPGETVGILTLQTNDPDATVVEIEFRGEGLEPPLIRIEPAFFEVTAFAGNREARTLTLSNDGGSDLEYTLELTPEVGFVELDSPVDSVPPYGSSAIEVVLDTGGLAPGSYSANIAVDSNDPATPQIIIPVILNVLTGASIEVSRELELESVVSYFSSAAVTNHQFGTGSSPVGSGSVTLVAVGDYEQSYELATLSIEGAEIGSVGDTTYSCTDATGTFAIDVEQLEEFVADGVIDIEVKNSDYVGAPCTINRHTVRLEYPLDASLVDFGTLFVRETERVDLVVRNLGTDLLSVSSITTDLPEFSVSASAFDLPPGASSVVTVTFTPIGVGEYDGSLDLLSNDPDTPVASVLLRGVAIDPPVLVVEPRSINRDLYESATETQILTIDNLGGSPLELTTSLIPPNPPFVSLDTAAAIIPPGGSTAIGVVLDMRYLASGSYQATIEILTNAPAAPLTRIPVSVTLTDGPDIVFLSEPTTLESVRDYAAAAGERTFHEFEVENPVGPGTLELLADGDFQSYYSASAYLEGVQLGSVGGATHYCGRVSGSFPVSGQDFLAVAADGVVEVEVRNWPTGRACYDIHTHTVRLSFSESASDVDFGETFVGVETERRILVMNNGSQALHVTSIVAGAPNMSVSPTSLVLPPGESADVVVRFLPSAPGSVSGNVIFESNDPDRAQAMLPVGASVLDPPVIEIAPDSLEAILPVESLEVQTLSVSNSGGIPLEFVVDLTRPVPGAVDSPFTEILPGAADGAEMSWMEQIGFDPEASTRQDTDSAPPFIGADARFELRGSGPGSMSCVAEDPESGHIYASIDADPGFYRYDAATDTWTSLAGSPFFNDMSEFGCGATVLNGKVYVSHVLFPWELLEYDIATDSWSVRRIPAISSVGTAAITDDGGRYVYMSLLTAFWRVDIITGEYEFLSSPPFSMNPWGGLAYLDGKVYAHSTSSFASYDVATEEWTELPDLPEIGGLGATVNPETSEYVATGPFNGRNLYRYSVGTGTWRVSTNPFFDVYLGGPAWLPGPDGGIYIVQGFPGPGLARAVPQAPFLAASPASGTVPPFDSLELEILFDATGVPAGVHDGVVGIVSNDPVTPRLSVPATLTVQAAPDIALAGEPITLESSLEFFGNGLTEHEFPIEIATTGPAGVELTVEGDLAEFGKLVTAEAEGIWLGVLYSDEPPCEPETASFTLDPSDLTAVAADGTIEIDVINSSQVEPSCETNRHTVRLTYNGAVDELAFGTVFVGTSGTLAVDILNQGSVDLLVSSVSTDGPDVGVSPQSVTVPAGGSSTLTVTYSPTAVRSLAGSVVIESNDPDEPVIELPLRGESPLPPVAQVDPLSVEAALPPNSPKTKTRIVRLANPGGYDLEWRLATAEILSVDTPSPEWIPLAKGDESENGAGAVETDSVGGPDAYGYAFGDSDEPGGPWFDWVDISTTGTPADLAGDDQITAPVSLGFEFPFYGDRFDKVVISTNGWLSFTSRLTAYSNPDSLPNAGFSVPENLVAPFWDDLHLRGENRIHYYNDGSRFIVQYTAVDRFVTGSTLTFQAILYPTGRIVFQYESLSGVLDSATIGIQNDDRSMGLLVSYNEVYARDGLAVEVAPPSPDWMSVAPTHGTVPPGEAVDLELSLSGLGRSSGDLQANLTLESNDPFNERVEVPVTLHLAEFALESVDIEPNTLNLGSQGNTIRAWLRLPAEYDPHDVDVSTVSIEGVLFANPSPVSYRNRNAGHEIGVRFDRQDFAALTPEGNEIAVRITGEVENTAWFTGTGSLRAIRPRLRSPNGGEVLAVGTPVRLEWDPPDDTGVSSYELILTRDGGETWEVLASGVTDPFFDWVVEGRATLQARVRVFALDNQGVMGYDTSDADFGIALPTPAPNTVETLILTASEPSVVLAWQAPPEDASHGAAVSYRVLRASGANGPFVEVGVTPALTFADPDGAETLTYYRVVATNAAGESP